LKLPAFISSSKWARFFENLVELISIESKIFTDVVKTIFIYIIFSKKVCN